MVSGSILPLFSRYFSSFLHSTSSLSVSQEYLALPDGAGRFPQGFSDPAVLRILLALKTLRLRDYHPLRSNFPVVFHFFFQLHIAVLQPRLCRNKIGLGCSPFARHYLGNHYCFLFLRLLRCFSSAGWPVFLQRRKGYPIRKSSDITAISASPKLIAAGHVLHRL